MLELFLRQEMGMPLAGCRQRPLHRFLRIAAIGLRGLGSGERTALAVRRFGFLQFGRAAVPTGIKRKQLRQPSIFLRICCTTFSMPG